jgi:hypothetical protein
MKVEQKNFPNYGYSISALPEDVLDVIKKEISNLQTSNKDKIYKNLAGHLESQYYLKESRDVLTPVILELANEYLLSWNYESEILRNNPTVKAISFKLDHIWANLQKKTEYNPLHSHTGVFSFVAWINIPYDLETEMNMPNVSSSNNPLATTFNFVYTNVFGEISTLPFFAEKKHEGTIIFFPAKLKHLVYPFLTSDEHRITISGNVSLNDNL